MTSGQDTWSARCVETRTAGAAGGPGKPTGSDPGRAPRSDPTSCAAQPPHTIFPQTRRYGSGPDRSATTSRHSLQRHERSTLWFRLCRRGGRVILHHGHIRPVLIRDWSRSMDGIAATIWASRTTLPLEPDDRLSLATS